MKKRFEEGVVFFQQGNDKEAETRFLEVLREDPTLVLPQQYLGMLYTRANRWVEAKTAFQAVIKKAPTFPGGYFGLALVLKNQGDIEQAKALFGKTVTLAPTQYNAWFYFGQLSESQGKIDEAVEAYQKVLQHSPAGTPEARDAERRVAELGATPETARQVQALVTEAAARLQEKNLPAAWALYQKAAALLPKSLQLRLFLADLATQVGDPVRALALFKEAVAIDPAAIQPHLALAKFYEKVGSVDDTIQEYETVLLLNHDDTIPEIRSAKEALFSLLDRKEIETHTRKGNLLMKEKKGDAAIVEFQAAAAVDPGLAAVHHNLALFYDEVGRHDLALPEIEEALILDPDSRVLQLLLGKTQRERGAYRLSIAAYVKVLSLQKNRDIFSLEAESGLYQTALAMLKSTLEANPPFVEGVTKKSKGEQREAQALLEEAARLSPESAPIYYYLGEIYEGQGTPDKATATFERAVELQPAFYPAWRKLARLYTQQGSGSKGVDAYERLLRLSDDNLKAMAMSRPELEKERDAARQKLEQAREKTRALFNRAQAALAKGEKEEAIALLQEAHTEEKDNLSILYSLGIAYGIENKWPEASEAFSAILHTDPTHAGALLRLGAVQEARGLLPTAAQTYRRLLNQKEKGELPEYKEAATRLAALNESLKQYREAERHEKRGLAVLSTISDNAAAAEKEKAAAPSGGKLTPAQLQLALWDLKEAIVLRPKEARYHYNLGLLYEHVNFGEGGLNKENAKRVKEDRRLLEEPASAYRAAVEIDHRYLPAYARLGQLYEWQEDNNQAMTYYRLVLSEAPSPPPREVEEIKARVEALEKRFFGNVGYTVGIDSNFPLTEPAQDDYFNTLSANLTYYVVKGTRLQIPLSYQGDTTFYYRAQVYYSNHSLSLGLQHHPTPPFSYGFSGRYQASLAKGSGLALLLTQGTASVNFFSSLPTVTSLEYAYTDTSYPSAAQLDSQEQRGTLLMNHSLPWRDDLSFSYTYTYRLTPRTPSNSYQGHRFQLGYQRWVLPYLQFRGSASILFQNFLNPELTPGQVASLIGQGLLPSGFDANQLRENRLLSYSVGFFYPWSDTTSLFVDYQWQKNRSNIASAASLGQPSVTDVLLGRNPSIGPYEKRVLRMGVTVAF
ncbi:MAG: tetratricopeptide repeat protein [Nitrospirae bacterium]|nr:tetratricopeptide repeat protein [Candidatus Manganitrophaceae bacterium]